MATGNVSVDLILWHVEYVIYRTMYDLDKFYIQWLYEQKWILELSVNTIQYNTSQHFIWSILYLLQLLILVTKVK